MINLCNVYGNAYCLLHFMAPLSYASHWNMRRLSDLGIWITAETHKFSDGPAKICYLVKYVGQTVESSTSKAHHRPDISLRSNT